MFKSSAAVAGRIASRLAVIAVAAFILAIEYVLADWLLFGPFERDRPPTGLNLPRALMLTAITAAAVGLHLRSGSSADN